MTSSSDTEDDSSVWSSLQTNKNSDCKYESQEQTQLFCKFLSLILVISKKTSKLNIVKYQGTDETDTGRNQLNILSPPTPHSLLIQSCKL
jgi:hypothetical protein